MKKASYQKPETKVLELVTENVIATSGDAGGTVNPMPPGCNKREWYDCEWGNSADEKNNYWE